PDVKSEGIILVNSSLAKAPEDRKDCMIIELPANDIAEELGNSKAANMVMLGAYVQLVKPVSLESIKASLTEVLPERYHKLIPLNESAISKGAEIVEGK
ncbi:MAG: 2-oxoacid:acceptor oxidoreductase family protein, partial [Armatimonadota bacterium]